MKNKHSNENKIDKITSYKTTFKTLPTFKCEYCDYTRPNKASIKSHIKKVHSEKTLLFPCDECEARYVTKKGLSGHIRIKHPEYSSNLLNINVTTPHPRKELNSKKRKLEDKPEKEDESTTIIDGQIPNAPVPNASLIQVH